MRVLGGPNGQASQHVTVLGMFPSQEARTLEFCGLLANAQQGKSSL